MQRFFRIGVLFVFGLFFLARQIYVNLLHVDRSVLSLAFVSVMISISIWSVWKRTLTNVSTFLFVDIALLLQFVFLSLTILTYFCAGVVNATEVSYAVYYHCFAPLLVYTGFLFVRETDSQVRQDVVTGAALVYLVMLFAGCCQVLGIDVWLFRNEKWYLMPTSFSLFRATGTYGTQIDFGMISFVVFLWFFVKWRNSKSFCSAFMTACAFAGALLSFSRVFILACLLLPICTLLRPKTLGYVIRKPRFLVAAALASALCIAVLQQMHVDSILFAQDKYTQESNQARLSYLESTPRWLLASYPLVGVGPGTQNGPNDNTKLVGDFLWLGLLLEFGLLVGAIVVIFKLTIPALVILAYMQSRHRSPLATSALVLSVMFICVSFLDSAFAHMVTIAIYYIIAGRFLQRYHAAGECAERKHLLLRRFSLA